MESVSLLDRQKLPHRPMARHGKVIKIDIEHILGVCCNSLFYCAKDTGLWHEQLVWFDNIILFMLQDFNPGIL